MKCYSLWDEKREYELKGLIQKWVQEGDLWVYVLLSWLKVAGRVKKAVAKRKRDFELYN